MDYGLLYSFEMGDGSTESMSRPPNNWYNQVLATVLAIKRNCLVRTINETYYLNYNGDLLGLIYY